MKLRDRVLETGVLIVTLQELGMELDGDWSSRYTTMVGTTTQRRFVNKLAGMGLGVLPELEQEILGLSTKVRLYGLGSTIAKVINAVLHPSSEGDQLLISIANGEAEQIIKDLKILLAGV